MLVLLISLVLAACDGGSGGQPNVLGTPELIEANPGTTSGARIATAQNGQAIAVWSQINGVAESIQGNRYLPDSGWGIPEPLGTDAGRLPEPEAFREHLSLAVDPSGSAIVVWTQIRDDTNDISIWANQYKPGIGWEMPGTIEQGDGWTFFPQVAMDSSANAIAVWGQVDGSGYGLTHSVWSNRFESGTGWETPELLETEPDTIVNGPRIAMNSAGSAIAVWQQWEEVDGGRYNAWANNYEPGIGWGTPVLLETESGMVWGLQVGVDANGDAIVTWTQSDGLYYNLWAVRYEVGTDWGVPEMIEVSSGDVGSFGHSLAVSPNGEAIAVWLQPEGAELSIWSNHFDPDTGWGNPELVETSPEDAGIRTDVAFAPNGEAVAVWMQPHATYMSIWTSRYSVWRGWDDPKLLEENEGDANSPRLAIDSAGNVFAVWAQWDGAQDSLWANRF